MATKLAITLKKSPIGRPQNQRRTAEALGLKKLHQTVVRSDTDVIRGMVDTISHLVTVETVDAD